MQTEKIDVLIPVYNCEKYIGKCLDSLLNQTYKDINIIVNNNGSTDETGEILEDYKNKYKNIVVYETKNEGNIAKARNFLIDKINSSYFTFFDADDYAEPDFLEILYNMLIASDADMSVCARIRHKESKDLNLAKRNKKLNKAFVLSKDVAIAEMLSSRLFNGSLCNKLFKKNTLGDIRCDENIHYGEDLDFCFKIMQNCNKVIYSEKQLYHYIVRNGGGSIVTSKFNPKKLTCIDCYDNIIEQVKDNEMLNICARSMQGLIATEILYYIWRDKYKDKELKKRLKLLIKESVPYIRKNKKLPRLYRNFKYVWWLTKLL